MMMQLKVLLFAGLAEAVGQRSLNLSVPPTVDTVQAFKDYFAKQYPDHRQRLARAMIAVNRSYAKDDATLQDGDEVGLIPPVGGGSPPEWPACLLTTEPLVMADAYDALRDARFGGTVLFSGTVREWTRGRQTLHLTYEAYSEMAMAQMEVIRRETEAQFPGCTTLQWHRIGYLVPTDIAVICAAASPHRDEAFAAARTLIERLKKEVPIWKKEIYADGESLWQENDRP